MTVPGSPPAGVVVTVDPERFPQTVEAARRAGLRVLCEFPLLGSLSGTIAEERIPALRAVEGVRSVEREQIVRLPPPDSPLQ